MPTRCIMHAGLVLSAHAHNIEYYGLVMVVNNASGRRLAGMASSNKSRSIDRAMCAWGMCSIEL